MGGFYKIITEAMSRSELIAVLLEPGPGDALRFVHALCTKARREAPANTLVILGRDAALTTSVLVVQCMLGPSIATAPVDLSRELMADGVRVVHVGERLVLVLLPSFSTTELAVFFRGVGAALSGGIDIYHCYEPRYIDDNSRAFHIDRHTAFPNIAWKYIDRNEQGANMSGFISDFIVVPRKMRRATKEAHALFFIRQSSIVPERNTPWRIIDRVVSVLGHNNVRVSFAGHLPAPTLLPSELKSYIIDRHLFRGQEFPSYLAQMKLYGANFDLAIGVNSGGLDLALAAGVPGVRIGAFHQTIPKHGRNYNRFLTTSVVINVPSSSETAVQDIAPETCIRALYFLMMNLDIADRSFLWLEA